MLRENDGQKQIGKKINFCKPMIFFPNKPPNLREHPHNIAVLDMTKIANNQISKGKSPSQNQQERLIRGKKIWEKTLFHRRGNSSFLQKNIRREKNM